MTDLLFQVPGSGEPEDRSHERWPIEDVLEHYGWDGSSRRGSSGWAKVCCPFHGERNASAAYSEELNSFRCFVCGAKGNSVTLVMDQEGLEQDEAVEWLKQHVAEGPEGRSEGRSPARRPLPWERGYDR